MYQMKKQLSKGEMAEAFLDDDYFSQADEINLAQRARESKSETLEKML